jgi:hypothetical protein
VVSQYLGGNTMNAYTNMTKSQLEALYKEFKAEQRELDKNAQNFGWTSPMLSRNDVIIATLKKIEAAYATK